jgi:hypothetical protein
VDPSALVPLAITHPALGPRIAAKIGAGLVRDARICRKCLSQQRIAHTVARLEEERGELTAIEAQIATHAASHLSIAQNAQLTFEQGKTLGDRIADRVSSCCNRSQT